MLIIDITKARPGTALVNVTRVRDRHPHVTDDQIQIICTTHQRPELARLYPGASALPGDSPTGVALARFIQKTFLNRAESFTPDAPLIVASYHPEVLELGDALPAEVRDRVHFTRVVVPSSDQLSAWPNDRLPLNEAIPHLLRVLREHNVSEQNARRRSQIPRLLSDDAVFQPIFATRWTGLTGILLKEAIRQRLVATDPRGGDAGDPWVWLPEPKSESSKASPAIAPPSPDRTDTGKIIDILRTLTYGPFSNVRETLFDALEESVQTKGTLGDVIESAVAGAKTKLQNATYPWRYVRRFLERLLTDVPVLLDESGNPVKPSFETLETRIAALANNWRNLLTGQIIYKAIVGAGAIPFDLVSLTEALFGQHTAQKEKLTRDAITSLLTNHRVVLDNDGALRAADNQVNLHAVPSAVS